MEIEFKNDESANLPEKLGAMDAVQIVSLPFLFLFVLIMTSAIY